MTLHPRVLRTALASLALALVAGLAGNVATANAAGPVQVWAHADPAVRAAEAESGSDHDPYVAFGLTNARKGSKYRLVVQTSPVTKKDRPCNPGLTTSFTPVLPAVAGGRVVFDLEPVTSGTYFPFAGHEPCYGRYVIAVQEQPTTGRFRRVRTFAFSYPSLKITYLPTSG
jgi:hypothetical protein